MHVRKGISFLARKYVLVVRPYSGVSSFILLFARGDRYRKIESQL